MPLLTHDETGATSVARGGAGPVADRDDDFWEAPSPAPSRWRRVRRVLYVLLGLTVIGPFLAFVLGWVLFDVPSADDLAITQVATFTFAGGEPLATVRPENINREKVTLDKVDEHVKQAVLAAEDRTFYSNPGFDITGIGRAAYNQLTGGVGGGSTITQQYVKVTTGQDAFSLWRKYKEVVLAVKISREQTKDQILENYLNTIYFGRGAYGIQAAAKAYFGRAADDLTLSEGAMLAGVIQSPSRWDPAKDPEGSERRWNFVLDGMAEQGWITASDRAAQTFPDTWLLEPPTLGGVPDDATYHIYDKARAELEAVGVSEDQLNTAGLTVTTTVDWKRQQDAVEAVTKALKGQPENLRSALVSVNAKTGAIEAYYGGANGLGTDYADALRQPGSSFKPFVLAAALQGPGGVGLGTTYDGSSPQDFEGNVRVSNSEGFDCGECTVKTAMTRSINTVFYRMALDVGIPNVIDAAHRAGIPRDLLREVRGGTALGDQEVHPIDMAGAFATFAADGLRHEPYLVSRVVAADGQVLYARADSPGEQALPQRVARNVTEAMLDVARSSSIGLADGRPVAAKTGTVQHPTIDGQNKDAWTVGFTPSVSTAVWVGSDQSDPIQNASGRPIYGRMLPGSIWQSYMNDAVRGTPREQFSKFVPLGDPPVAERTERRDGPRASGNPAPSGSPRTGFPDLNQPGGGDRNGGNGRNGTDPGPGVGQNGDDPGGGDDQGGGGSSGPDEPPALRGADDFFPPGTFPTAGGDARPARNNGP